MDALVDYLRTNWVEVQFAAQTHFLLVLYSVTISTVIAVGLAIALHTSQLAPESWSKSLRANSREAALLLSSAALTVPSLALFSLLQPPLGLGIAPAIIGLAVYGVYPVLRNTVAGLSSVDPAVMEAARGVGMGSGRRMLRIQLPLAWPVILSGIRVAVLIMIAIAAVAAIISQLGFGQLLLDGLTRLGGAGSFEQVIVGTFGCLAVAAVFEIAFVLVQRFTAPRGTTRV